MVRVATTQQLKAGPRLHDGLLHHPGDRGPLGSGSRVKAVVMAFLSQYDAARSARTFAISSFNSDIIHQPTQALKSKSH